MNSKGVKRPGKFGKYFGGSDIPIQIDAAGLGVKGEARIMDPKGYGKKDKPQGLRDAAGLGLRGGSGLIGIALVLALFMSGCVVGAVKDKVQGKVLSILDKDLSQVVHLAEKYGEKDSSIAKCARYLQGALAGKQELLAEETKGLLSRALKSKLLAQYVRKDEAAFKEECRDFSADIMLELGKSITGN